MSFFPGSFLASAPSNDASFHPLFRFLDDFEQHRGNFNTATTNNNPRQPHTRQIMKSFTPKFDVKEVAEAYELHGDLPGIEQKDIEIEFTDIQTITVHGRTERSYTAGTPPAVEGTSAQKSIEGSGSNESTTKAHKATVEDGDGDTVVVAAPKNNNSEVAKEGERKVLEAKYWVSERSVGEFSRSFTFPVRVDQDSVTASMKNGVLSIVVPKAKKHEARKIPIWSTE